MKKNFLRIVMTLAVCATLTSMSGVVMITKGASVCDGIPMPPGPWYQTA